MADIPRQVGRYQIEAMLGGVGIIHRDIKPANILIAAGGSVKILDFGISRIVVPDIQQSASLVGTPSYMAPEQCRGEAVDGRSDLFAVGCVMFELLTGERAFAGTNPYEIGNRIINQRHPSLPAL
ncbi:MAG: protein kinase domain-containing protein, partial [Rhodopila sp.]